MNTRYHRFWLRGLAVLAALAVGGTARAGEVEKLLPDDTEILLTVNVKQAFGSGLAKKLGLDKLKDHLKEFGEATDILKDLGFDPFTDIDRVLVASPGGSENDKGLVIVRGTFDLAKFKAKGEDAAKNFSDHLKITKVGDHILYEVILPGSDPSWFVSLPGKDVLLASPGKDYVVDALKKFDGKAKTALKSKDFRGVVEKMNDKQTLSLAALGSALLKGGLNDTPAKDVLEKFDAVGGGLTVTDDLKVEVVLSAKSADDARAIERSLDDGLKTALGFVSLLAGSQKELNVVLELLKSVKIKTDDKLVMLKAMLDADAIDKALKKDV